MTLKNIKLLYAEDNSELRSIMKSLIESEVKELYIVKNGEEAYELYKTKKPDILLLDINMPIMNGLEIAKKVRISDHNTRIIMLTAYSDVEYLLQATELKLTKYLVKPIVGNQLFEALNLATEELSNFTVQNKKQLKLDDEYTWNFTETTLFYNLQEVRLTPKEKKIINILFSNINLTITYDTLLTSVWDDFEQCSIDTLKTMMKNIRKKLPENTIQNVYGIGYKVMI